MSKKSKVAQLTLLCSLALVLVFGVFAARGVNPQPASPVSQPAAVDCSDDAKIAAEVVANIRKGFTPEQLKLFKTLNNFHVGVTCLKGVVTLTGRVPGKPTFNKVIKLARKTSCVIKVDKSKFSPFSVGGCNSVTETECCDGSICVIKGAECPLCVPM